MCMYVCMHMCGCEYMYVCSCVYVCGTCVSVYRYMWGIVCVCAHVCMYVHWSLTYFVSFVLNRLLHVLEGSHVPHSFCKTLRKLT